METVVYILIGILVNAVIGAGICSLLDTKEQVFYNWYKQDPTGGLFSFFVLEFWPIMAFFMWRYRNGERWNISP